MFRPSRSLTTWLLWLAIALLPVRAWAAAAMPTDASNVAVTLGAAERQVAAIAEPSQPKLPCHGASEPTDEASTPQACSLCGVCHAAFALLPSTATALPSSAPERPLATEVPAVETPALAGPERPPRLRA